MRENNPTNNPANKVENSANSLENRQLWYVDSGCSRHMTGEKSSFLSLTASSGGSVAFGNGKTGTIIGIGSIGKTPSQYIDNVHLVDGLKHNLLSVSQLCDKNNLVLFSRTRSK